MGWVDGSRIKGISIGVAGEDGVDVVLVDYVGWWTTPLDIVCAVWSNNKKGDGERYRWCRRK